MRLFKFLVISDEVMEKCGIPEARNNKTGRIINAKNEFYSYRYDLNLNHPENGDKAIAFMSIDYPNEDKKFGDKNKAYVIINLNEIENVMNLISPVVPTKRTTKVDKKGKIKESYDNFQGCLIKDCNYCNELCKNKEISVNISSGERYIRGKTWSFANDKAGTKLQIEIGKRVWYYEPKTGGIAHSSIQWEGETRPATFKEKTIAIPLHHWIKCHSIPNKPIKKGDYSFYHIGNTFDYRKEFIGLATKGEQENLRKEIEPKNIRRGRRVIARQKYYTRTLKCDCELSESSPKCRDCEGVLYIDTKQGLEDLYYQLMSDEYRQLSEGKPI